MGARIEEGDRAPDVTLTDHEGQELRLYDLLGKGPVVLFFYPKDGTPVCTAEACAFRDASEAFRGLDATVVGVSGDDPERHRRFAEEHDLPYALVSDADGALRKRFGVRKTMGVLPGRVTYVIDRDGVVRKVFSSQTASREHVEKALDALGRSGG